MHKEFQVGEHVYLRVRPKKSSLDIESCAKLAPWFCGPFNILDRIGPMAYRLTLPPSIKVHDVFPVTGGTRGRVPAGTSMHPGSKTTYALKLSNRASQSAMEALWARGSHMGNG